MPRRYAQLNGLGPQFPSVFAGRQRLDPPGNDPGSQGMTSSETKYWSHMFPPTGQLLQSGRGDDPTADEAAIRQPGRFPGAGTQAEGYIATEQQRLQHERIQEITIQLSQLASQGDLIQRFSALKPMNRDQVPEDSQVTIPWRLDVSIRSAASTQLYEILNLLSGNGICQLILFRLRPTGLQRSPLATVIAHRVRR